MDEYTPPTEEVRIKYMLSSGRGPEAPAEFDRWLEAHDRQVTAKALRDMATQIESAPWIDGRPGLYFEGYEDGRKHAAQLALARAASIAPETEPTP